MGSGGQRKKFAPMIYFTITGPDGHYAFCNKSTTPIRSARLQFNRAYNHNRDDYDSPLRQWLREYPEEEYYISYSAEMPDYIERRAHLVELPPDFIQPEVVPFEKLYGQLAEEANIAPDRRKKSFTYISKKRKKELYDAGRYIWTDPDFGKEKESNEAI